MDPVTAVKLWVAIRPIRRIKEARQRRRERRMAESVTVTLPSGETVQRTEPMIPARTSTKLAVGNGVVAAFPAVEILQWIQSIEIPIVWLESLTNSDYFMYYGSLLVSYLIARFTKSPLVKQAL